MNSLEPISESPFFIIGSLFVIPAQAAINAFSGFSGCLLLWAWRLFQG